MVGDERTVRIFISSPGDVEAEREKARQVIHELQEQYTGMLRLGDPGVRVSAIGVSRRGFKTPWFMPWFMLVYDPGARDVRPLRIGMAAASWGCDRGHFQDVVHKRVEGGCDERRMAFANDSVKTTER